MPSRQSGKSYKKPSATVLQIEASALFSIIKHTSENYPSLYSGALLGFEDDSGLLDITHAYPYPYPDQYEGGSLRSKSGNRYQQEILDTLKELDHGIEFQGWFQSTVSGSYATNQLVDSLAQQQLSNNNAFVLIHNMASINKEIELKAIRLTENFIGAYIDGRWKTKDLENNKLSFLNIFEEIPIKIHNQHLVNLYLSNLEEKDIKSQEEFELFNLNSNQNSTAQLLESLYSQIDSYNFDQTNFNYYQRQLQKEHSKITAWKQQRKLDNFERQKRGEAELDLDEWQSVFRLPNGPSRYNNILYSHTIDELADDLLKKCDEELTKSCAIERKLTAQD
ncbi:eukaryotic translation initiation factor [Hyphopichia burtonii NRRL Y-1933]|uniref:Eukaryotic translation initiation factor 3 subunit H n=1 Tax=Hyphopichia burtonii NRRL Y-1933 TaxID=984485 RepID=A0A1E4RRI6_9ASCO|nr:eukaryotic translation initiation factor [Hyphopichia burtonii NRRL Y-1933]ODV69675.1 eukaryotic translation initiation factor [Hyphopichia burtonii NRRL Y-1933]